jgi:hypothetical protein
MWIHATLADDLMGMGMEDQLTAFSTRKQINDFFNTNKAGANRRLQYQQSQSCCSIGG